MAAYVTGRVLSVEAHPGADRIWLARVETGDGPARQIVFGGVPGAVTPGCLVPVLLPGMRTADGRRVRARTYRGARSEGILCSAAEAGLGPGDDRVHVLAEEEA